MSEAKVRWALLWRMAKGGPAAYWAGDIGWSEDKKLRARDDEPGMLMFRASNQLNEVPLGAIVRLVKLTRRAKGWRPASEPPNSSRNILVWSLNGERAQLGWWASSDRAWHLIGGGCVAATHWRELPAGPK